MPFCLEYMHQDCFTLVNSLLFIKTVQIPYIALTLLLNIYTILLKKLTQQEVINMEFFILAVVIIAALATVDFDGKKKETDKKDDVKV